MNPLPGGRPTATMISSSSYPCNLERKVYLLRARSAGPSLGRFAGIAHLSAAVLPEDGSIAGDGPSGKGPVFGGRQPAQKG